MREQKTAAPGAGNRSSRTENSLNNALYAMIAYAAKFLASFFFRQAFVRALQNTYTGVDGVFSTVLSGISLIELGYETAMSYLLYRPIAEGDTAQVGRIYAHYRRVSRFVACGILAIGALCLPILPALVGELPAIPEIRGIFLAVTVNMALENLLKYRRILLSAAQRQYVYTLAHYLAGAAMDVVQIAIVWASKNYILCLALQGAGLLLEAAVEEVYLRRHFAAVVGTAPGDTALVRRQAREYLGAAALHKAGRVLQENGDLLLVSQLAGVWAAGVYSNYKYILYALNSVYALLLESVAAGVGELSARRQSARSREVFASVQLAGAWIYGVSAVCLYVLLQPFIALWLGESSLFSDAVMRAVVVRFFVDGMKKAVYIYRDAMGLFRRDRFVPLTECLLTLGLSILFCRAGGMGVEGVLYASAMAAGLTSFWIEPCLLYRHGFGSTGLWGYFARYAAYAAATAGGCLLTGWVAARIPGAGIPAFLGKMAVCALVPNALFWLCFGRTAAFALIHTKVQKFLCGKRRARRQAP